MLAAVPIVTRNVTPLYSKKPCKNLEVGYKLGIVEGDKMFRSITIGLFLCILSTVTITAQSETLTSESGACEFNNMLLDKLSGEVSKGSERVFLISYSAKAEKPLMDNRRLTYTRWVFSDIKHFPKDKLTLATSSDRVEEKDIRLEFWLGSRLFLNISIKKNQQVCYLTHDYDPKEHRKVKKS